MENLNTQQLKQLQNNGEKLLIDLFATWCSPCKQLIPRLESLETKYTNVKFVKINVDENPDFAIEQNVRAVPTVIIFDGEKIINRSSGVNPDSFYTNILDTL